MNERTANWPELALEDWEPTYKTLHRWSQMLGKIRLGHTPRLNHWWNVTLYVTPRGLTTSTMDHGARRFSLELDFVSHRLRARVSDGTTGELPLEPMSVAQFYERLMETLEALDLPVSIWPVPVEVVDPVPFPEDTENASYDPDAVERLHRVLLQVDRVFQEFRGRFLGKASPSHFFWGAFDHAVTRFSGRENPEPPDDPVMSEGYSHELISHGWWPGGDWPLGGRVEQPMFYAYAVPEPDGFRQAELPGGGRYDSTLGEYLLEYEAVRTAADPDALLLDFMERTYRAGADAAGWDRKALEIE
ncbi:MAG: DUF5996 family protein [Thermoanaerobaculia bacterium]|nr:DUF5996 family protein [Thermoanaerobaculia bacterium]